MNQILSTTLKPNVWQKKIWFKFQFIFSIFIVLTSILCIFSYLYYLSKKEKISNNLINNYNIYKLYQSNDENINDSEEVVDGLFGIIEIPKINLYYPVFSHLTDDLLKISPCKFYGENIDVNGNICIAGHNYDNSLFFSKINTLSNNDEIFIITNHKKYIYLVYSIYEVKPYDVSPIFNYTENEKTLTLVTCNNINSNRIILKAKSS